MRHCALLDSCILRTFRPGPGGGRCCRGNVHGGEAARSEVSLLCVRWKAGKPWRTALRRPAGSLSGKAKQAPILRKGLTVPWTHPVSNARPARADAPFMGKRMKLPYGIPEHGRPDRSWLRGNAAPGVRMPSATARPAQAFIQRRVQVSPPSPQFCNYLICKPLQTYPQSRPGCRFSAPGSASRRMPCPVGTCARPHCVDIHLTPVPATVGCPPQLRKRLTSRVPRIVSARFAGGRCLSGMRARRCAGCLSPATPAGTQIVMNGGRPVGAFSKRR